MYPRYALQCTLVVYCSVRYSCFAVYLSYVPQYTLVMFRSVPHFRHATYNRQVFAHLVELECLPFDLDGLGRGEHSTPEEDVLHEIS